MPAIMHGFFNQRISGFKGKVFPIIFAIFNLKYERFTLHLVCGNFLISFLNKNVLAKMKIIS